MVRPAIGGLVLLVALFHAWQLRWVAEDAYISLRYARNLVEGHGLVFNIGERVEGYTNFLWTLLLAAGLSIDIEPALLTQSLGLFFTAMALVCLLRLHRRLLGGRPHVPVAIVGLALNYTWASYGTSGLETSLLSALIAALFLLLAEWQARSGPPRPFEPMLAAAGALMALAMMTRPDALLLIPPAVVLVLRYPASRGRLLRPMASLLLPLVAIYLPYFLWRYGYYGHPFPNTFYAKGANLSYFGQGLYYLWEFVQRYFLWVFLPFLPLAAWMARRRAEPLTLALGLFCVLHTYSVVRVGGDFMEGRFFVPILPYLYLLVEQSLRALFHKPAVKLVALGALVASVAVNHKVIEPRQIEHGITDERSWAPVFGRWYHAGAVFGRHLPEGTLVATDAVGAFGYGSRLPLVDTLGLTDETVAHLPLARRSRPGHEKTAPPEYLEQRKVAIIRDGLGRYPVRDEPDLHYSGNAYYLMTDDPAVVAGFRRAAAELAAAE